MRRVKEPTELPTYNKSQSYWSKEPITLVHPNNERRAIDYEPNNKSQPRLVIKAKQVGITSQ